LLEEEQQQQQREGWFWLAALVCVFTSSRRLIEQLAEAEAEAHFPGGWVVVVQ